MDTVRMELGGLGVGTAVYGGPSGNVADAVILPEVRG